MEGKGGGRFSGVGHGDWIFFLSFFVLFLALFQRELAIGL